MRTDNVNQIDEHIPGLVIAPEGKFITMKDENHETFFQNILGPLLKKEGISPRTIMNEHNLATLMRLLLNGIVFVPDLKEVYTPQLESILALVNKMNEHYNVSIFQINPNEEEDLILDQSDILNELNSRKQKIK